MYADVKPALGRSRFRSRFHLSDRDRAYIASHGWGEVRAQARAILLARLAPAFPDKDGSQTPMRGHPVFLAQHATAACCRGCLEKWHHIPAGRPLTDQEVDFVLELLLGWLREQAGDLERFPVNLEFPWGGENSPFS